jgi:hypothetical protein
MELLPDLAQPSYSVSLILPFLAVLEEIGALPEAVRTQFRALDPAARIPASAANAMLSVVVQLTGDELVGLKASAKMTTPG